MMSEFLQSVRKKTRMVGLADSTEQTYVSWIKRFILFHKYQLEAEIEHSPCKNSDHIYFMTAIMYGAGLRVTEVCSLRVKDFDFAHQKNLVTETKGDNHRVTFLPKRIIPQLKAHLELVKAQHQRGEESTL